MITGQEILDNAKFDQTLSINGAVIPESGYFVSAAIDIFNTNEESDEEITSYLNKILERVPSGVEYIFSAQKDNIVFVSFFVHFTDVTEAEQFCDSVVEFALMSGTPQNIVDMYNCIIYVDDNEPLPEVTLQA